MHACMHVTENMLTSPSSSALITQILVQLLHDAWAKMCCNEKRNTRKRTLLIWNKLDSNKQLAGTHLRRMAPTRRVCRWSHVCWT